MKLDADFRPFTQIHSKRIINLNVKHKTIKVKIGNIEENPDDLGYNDDLFDSYTHD